MTPDPMTDLPQPYGSHVGPTSTPCHFAGCEWGQYHRGPHSCHVATGEPRRGDMVYDPVADLYGRIVSLTPQGAWPGDERRRVWVEWGISRFYSDAVLSDLIIVRKGAP